MKRFPLAGLAAFTVRRLFFLKPKWSQFASDPRFPGANGRLKYWSVRSRFERQVRMAGINYSSRGCSFIERIRAAVNFVAAFLAANFLCDALSGAAK